MYGGCYIVLPPSLENAICNADRPLTRLPPVRSVQKSGSQACLTIGDFKQTL